MSAPTCELSARALQLVRRVEAWAQEEIGGKRRLVELLAEQERALSADDPDALVRATEAVAAAVEAETPRARAREELVHALAAEWGLAPAALSLGGIAGRAGAHGARLAKLRGELRAACEQALAAGRRIALVSQAQRAVLGDVLQAVLAAGRPDLDGKGGLVDAEG